MVLRKHSVPAHQFNVELTKLKERSHVLDDARGVGL